MIWYLDTSAIVKLLILETGTDSLVRMLDGRAYASSRVSYAEARAALAKREREQPLPAATWVAARQQLDADWPSVRMVEITQPLVERAGEFAEAFALRGFDAVQLASADAVRASVASQLHFVSFDRTLNRAARLLGWVLPATAEL